jgi:hypothetical protein
MTVDTATAADALGVHPHVGYLALPAHLLACEHPLRKSDTKDAWRIYEEVIRRHGSRERHLRSMETRSVLACLNITLQRQ